MLDHLLLHVVPARPPVDLEQTEAAGVGFAVLYEFRLDRWRIFGGEPADVKQLIARLLPADQISGFNLLQYDFPILLSKNRLDFRNGSMYRILAGRTSDLCGKICAALNKDHDNFPQIVQSWSLDMIGRGTLETPRIGTGTEASRYLLTGNWPAAASYALDDAALVKGLVLFVERHGYVVHHNSGQRLNLRHANTRSPMQDMDPVKQQVLDQ